MSSLPRPVRAAAVAALAAALFVATACQPHTTEHPTFTEARLTPDEPDRYAYAAGPAGVTGSAPSSNRSDNLRTVGFPHGQVPQRDAESCVTWTEVNGGLIQPGVALRIVASPDRVRAVTVTNNILFGARWLYNVHLGDSAADTQMTRAGTVALPDWTASPLPWRICGRVEGTKVTVKAWPLSTHPDEPAWNDPTYTGTVTIPGWWVHEGNTGWYMGHLAAGEHLTYTDLSAFADTSGSAPAPGPEPAPEAVAFGG